ncbi:MAG: polyphenol oxidase family protein [Myxococcota bacterium]
MLTHPLLREAGVEHGFALRDTPMRPDLLRPRQVHGTRVVSAADCRERPPPEADAVVSAEPAVAVGVVTADCVPVLLAARSGRVVAAVHAGWRGLAAGVVAQGVDAVRRNLAIGDGVSEPLLAAVGPHIGACCYEVDAPVLDALAARFGPLGDAQRPVRPGHALLDLGALVARDLVSAGLAAEHVAHLPDACTRCDAQRFHSYRRDGARAGRLWHFVAATPSPPT